MDDLILADNLRALGAILRDHREQLGLSLREACSRTENMSPGCLSKLERGLRSNPTVATYQDYSAALGLRFIFGVKGPES